MNSFSKPCIGLVLLLFLIPVLALGQTSRKRAQADSIRLSKTELNDSTEIWTLNEGLKIWLSGDSAQIWQAESNVEDWKISQSTQAWTLNRISTKLWKVEDSIKVWREKPGVPGKQQSRSADFRQLNDSVKLWGINDSLVLAKFGDTTKVWLVNPHTEFWQLTDSTQKWQLSDTTHLLLANDSIKLWNYQHKSLMWKREKQPNVWHVSSMTEVWTIDEKNEIWKAGNKTDVWQKNADGSWEKNDTIRPKILADSIKIWQPTPETMLWDSAGYWQIWHKKPEKTIFSVFPDYSGKVWRVPPPPPPEPVLPEDTIQIEPKKDSIILLQIDQHTKLWILNDSVRIWKYKNKPEVWALKDSISFWKINDTTSVWTMGKTKVSRIGQEFKSWHFNDSLHLWEEAKRVRHWKVDFSDTLDVWEINSHLKLQQSPDSISFWDVNPNVKIVGDEPDNLPEKIWILNDTTKIWQVEEDVRLRLIRDSARVWHKSDSIKRFEINDSTTIWQINDHTRLSMVNDTLIVWNLNKKTGRGWKKNTRLKPTAIDQSGKILSLRITPRIEVWKTPEKVTFWRLSGSKVWSVSDSIKVWAFVPPPKAPLIKKPEYWTIGGDGNLKFSQMKIKNWAAGGEDNLSLLAILKLHAKYAKKKSNWDNALSLRLGGFKRGDRSWFKNEDKTEINTKYGIRAIKKWYYSASFTIRTQLFEGFEKHPNDSVQISDFLAPGYILFNIGIDYKPTKNISIAISPLGTQTTFMRDTALAGEKFGLEEGQSLLFELGADITSKVKFDITKDIALESKLHLFTNYKENPQNIDIDWEATLNLKVNKYINTTINTHLIYDHDAKITVNSETGKKAPRTQFKELLSIGLYYKF